MSRSRFRFLTFLAVSILILTLGAAPVFAEMEIDDCGRAVPAGEVALLTTDLECADVEEAVLLADGARLKLNGHIVTAADSGVKRGVRCLAGTVCSVEGPGLIGGFRGSGIAGTNVRVRDVTLVGNGRAGVAAFENVRLVDSVVVDNGSLGVHAGGMVRSNRSHIGEHPVEDAVAAGLVERGRRRAPVVD